MREAVEKLKAIAGKYGYKFSEEDFTGEQDVLHVVLKKDNDVFHITFILDNGRYVAYDLTADSLPREIYSDSPSNNFTPAKRSDELLDNLEGILAKKLTFYSSPGIFNKASGYILMNIDGVPAKVPLKKNFLDLPQAKDTASN